MNRDEARRVIIDSLGVVAPEVDAGIIDDGRNLTEQLDIDSMDYLNWMLEINRVTGIDIPERDYEQLMTIDGAVGYLSGVGAPT